MHARGLRHRQLTPAAFLSGVDCDSPGVSIPRAESHLAVRFGSFELFAMGAREHAHRKMLRGGQRALMVQLRLGTQRAVFGAASELTGRIVPLRELWGDAACERLRERLVAANDENEVAAILEHEIALRVRANDARTALALEAAARLGAGRVHEVAEALGVSERNLRRVFRETIGMSPKTFAKLTRFHRALNDARASGHVDWAGVAAASGYYDQAHLIGEFRELAGVTPVALLTELSS